MMNNLQPLCFYEAQAQTANESLLKGLLFKSLVPEEAPHVLRKPDLNLF